MSYRGLCIGGPLDGQWLTSEMRRVECPKVPKVSTDHHGRMLLDDEAKAVGRFHIHQYFFIEHLAHGEAFGFWCRDQKHEKAGQYIMRQLMSSYERKANAK